MKCAANQYYVFRLSGGGFTGGNALMYLRTLFQWLIDLNDRHHLSGRILSVEYSGFQCYFEISSNMCATLRLICCLLKVWRQNSNGRSNRMSALQPMSIYKLWFQLKKLFLV
jgi:hypothetical protein